MAVFSLGSGFEQQNGAVGSVPAASSSTRSTQRVGPASGEAPRDPRRQLRRSADRHDGARPRLHCYPVKEWGEVRDRARPPQTPWNRASRRCSAYVASAQEVHVDKLGRVLILPQFRAHAGLEKDLVWAGMVKVIELSGRRTAGQKAQDEARHEADSADVIVVLTELRSS